jgi:hypothetical protein
LPALWCLCYLLFKIRETKSTARLTEGNKGNEGEEGQALAVETGFFGLRCLLLNAFGIPAFRFPIPSCVPLPCSLQFNFPAHTWLAVLLFQRALDSSGEFGKLTG